MGGENELPIFTSDVTQEVRIRMGTERQAAMPPTTVMHNWNSICQRLGDHPAIFQKRPSSNVSTGGFR